MAEKTYIELLRDPRWQRRRLEIMARDEFACLSCGDKERTLNVHHKRYRRGAKPWEYEDDQLITLCEDCHRSITVDAKAIAELVSNHGARGVSAIRKLAEAFMDEESLCQRGILPLEEVLLFMQKGRA